MTEAETKIEKLNAYQKIRSQKLNLGTKVDETVAEQITLEYTMWIDAQIAALLGKGQEDTAATSATSPFTDEEIEILRMLVQKVQQREGTAPTEVPRVQNGVLKSTRLLQRELSQSEKDRLNTNARPMLTRNEIESRRKNPGKALKPDQAPTAEGGTLLAEALDDMDRRAEEIAQEM